MYINMFNMKMWREREEKREGRGLLGCPAVPSVMDLVSAVSLAHLVAWDRVTRTQEALSDQEVEDMYTDIQDGAKRLGGVAERLSRHLARGARMYRALNGK